MSMNLKRPKPGEDENELLEFQNEFLKSINQQPSAKIIKENTPTEFKIKSESNEAAVKMDFDSDDQALARILSDVVERSTDRTQVSCQFGSDIPKIEKLDLSQFNTSNAGPKKKSLFAQNLEKKGMLKSFYPLEKISQPNEKIKLIEKSLIKDEKTEKLKQIITGDGLGNKRDVEQIHLENLQRLSEMKPDEILEEQRKLTQHLDPRIVSFIRKRNSNTQNEMSTNQTSNIKSRITETKDEILNDLPFKPDKKWLHMDKIEYEKLEWMIKSPKNVQDAKSESKSARFDFQGNVMGDHNEEEVPVTRALHHHGDEPDLAGYTLDELFHLSRSKFNQQRVLALQTIANILAKCHQGVYYEIIKSGSYLDANEEKQDDEKHNLLNQLIDGGVLFLLRWSLDDQTESIINVALIGLKNILQPNDQENMLDMTFDLCKGHEMPSLFPFSELTDDISGQQQPLYKLDKNLNVSERKELDQLSDEEYIKHDLIKGLFRMNLMARIYYLLDKYQPSLSFDQIIFNIFMILYRCLRHSAEISYDFTEKYSNLLDLIVRNFMPQFLNSNDLNSNNLLHLTNSIKLFRIICSSGSNMSFKMCKKYDLNNRLINYLALINANNSQELIKLQIESIRLLKVLTVYQSDYSQSSFETISNIFELLLKHLSSLVTLKNIQSNEYLYLQAILSLFNNFIANAIEDDRNLKLKYDMCSSVYSIVHTYTIGLFKTNDFNNLSIMSVCLNFIADYLEKINYGSFFVFSSQIIKDNRIDLLIQNLLFHLNSDSIMSKLVANSTFTKYNETFLRKIKDNNLSYLPTILNEISNTDQISTFCFLASYFKLYSLCFKLSVKSFAQNDFNSTRQLLNNSYLRSYLNNFQKSEILMANSFIRIKYENLMVYHFLKLVFNMINFEDSDSKKSLKNEDKHFYYLVSLRLVTCLKQGDEFYAHDIITSFIFNMNIWTAYMMNSSVANVLIEHFEKLRINSSKTQSFELNYTDLNVGGKHETIKIDKEFISNLESVHIYENLNQIKLTYLESNYLLNANLLENSRKLADLNKISSLFKSKLYSNKNLLDSDWIYAPIKYNLKKIQNKNELLVKDENSRLKLITSVSNALKFVYLLEAYFNEYLDLNLDLTNRFVHLLYIYLFDSEVFLDRQIVTYLYLIYFKLAVDKKCPLENLNLNKSLPDIISFYDFYQCLLTQYDSTSFGDYLFSMYMIVPLQQKYPVKYRQLFWSDFSHLFKYIKFSTSSNKLLVPLTNFTQPNEKSLNMIRLYSQILLDTDDYNIMRVSKFACSILISHLNGFIFEHVNNLEKQVEFDFKKLLFSKFVSLTNEKLKHDLVYFKCVNPNNNELEFYDILPQIRQQWIDKLNI